MPAFTMPLKDVIDDTGGEIGLSNYPIFDPAHRAILNGKIINHYFNREIGMETIEMFVLAMKSRMNEIMPYYNKLYASELIVFDPLATVDLTTNTLSESEQGSTTSGTSNTTSANTSASRSVSSEFPQTMLSGAGDHATAAADSNGTSAVTGEGTEIGEATGTGTETGETTVKGYQGVASELLMRYRESLLNIDLQIIRELGDLFMMVWDTFDNYSDNNTIGKYTL